MASKRAVSDQQAIDQRLGGVLDAEGIDNPDTIIGWERIALGQLLLSDDAESLLDRLRPEEFLTVPHEHIYATLMAHADKRIDQLATLRDLMGVRQVTAVMDPASYLTSCQQKAALAVGDYSWYASRIKEAAELRNAHKTVERAQQALKSRNMDTVRRVFEEGAAGAGDVTDNGPAVRLTSANSFTMKGTKWLQKGRIPAGMMTILAGREGIGKSTVSLDIAAHITRGTLEGRYYGKPQNVILCATEDSWEHTIIPRLRAVGADLSRVFHIAVQDETGGFRAITAPGDIRAIEKAIQQSQPALMLIDPIMAVIDGKIDTHVQQQVQQGLEPLTKMCERTMMAALGLIHVNKSTTTDALNSVMGSKAFTSLPRSVLYCIADPGEDGQFLLTHEKCNVGPKQNSLTYRLSSVRLDLDPSEVDDGDEAFITTSRVVWGGEDERKAGDVLAEAAADKSHGRLRKDIKDYLDGQKGCVSAADIVAELEDLDVTRANIDQTLKRMVKAGEASKPMRGYYQSAKLSPVQS
jgi:hypothetical protein